MTINILTLFPDYFTSTLGESILGRAREEKKVIINVINLRDFTKDKRQTTDDRPFGGGPGMVMKIEPIYLALKSLGLEKGSPAAKILLTSAKGQKFSQEMAEKLATTDTLTIICGHYEGVDERVAVNLIDSEVRIGDYVLTGGEPAANVMIDAVVRLLPGVLGNTESNKNESHSRPGFLAHPQFTRPEVFGEWAVPKILLSGNHEEIEAWRAEQTAK